MTGPRGAGGGDRDGCQPPGDPSGLADPLDLIADLIRAFASSQDARATMRQGLEKVVAHMGAEAGSLFLLDEDAETLVCEACRGPVDVSGLRLPADAGIVGRAAHENRAQLVTDVGKDPDFGAWVDEETGFSTRSILCAPLSVGDTRFGVVEILNKRGGDGRFDEDDRTLLEVLATAAALALLNARLTTQLVERERLQRELELAAEIQRALLPAPADPEDPIQGLNIAAYDVSGDFFDILTDPTGRRWFCIGDVSGKGMNAALLMAKTASLFRCLAKTQPGPGALLDAINAELCETATHGMFVTMVAGVLDPGAGRVVLANAGHEPPLLHDRAAGTFIALPAQAPPLGIDAAIAGPDGFVEESRPLGPGHDLVLMTDGVTEARRADGGMRGVEGVQDTLRAAADQPAGAVLTAMVEGLGGGDQARPRDDITLVLVRGEAMAAAQAGGEAESGVGIGAGAALGESGCPPGPGLGVLLGPGAGAVGDDPAALPALWGEGAQPGVGAAEVLLSVCLPARADRLRLIRAILREALDLLPAPCSEAWRHDLVIAVDEACQNVIRHAYPAGDPGPLILDLWLVEAARVVVTLRDFADPVDPSRIQPRPLDDLRPGGLGTHFIRSLTESCGFAEPPGDGRGGNLFYMQKALEPGAPPGS